MYSFGFCMMATPGKIKRIRSARFKLEDGEEIFAPSLIVSDINPEVLRTELYKCVDETLSAMLKDRK